MFKYHQRKKRRIKTVFSSHSIDPLEESVSSLIIDLAREALSDSEADIIQMRIDGYSYKEIAIKHGGTDVTMRKRLQRSIEKIIKYHHINTSNNERKEYPKED